MIPFLLLAALPPLFQDAREITAILESPKLSEIIPSGDQIQEIRHLDNCYLIVTTHHNLEVRVTYLPSKMAGPAPFDLTFLLRN